MLLYRMRVFTSRDDVDELAELTLSKHCFIKLYADWCGHCKAMQMSWDTAVASLNKDTYLELHDYDGVNEVIVAQVNDKVLSKMPEFIRKTVRGYPTIIEVQHGEIKNVYKGDRSSDDIYIWILINSDPKQVSDKNATDDLDETQSRSNNVCPDGPCNSQPERPHPIAQARPMPQAQPRPQARPQPRLPHRASMRKRALETMGVKQSYRPPASFVNVQNQSGNSLKVPANRRFSMGNNHFYW